MNINNENNKYLIYRYNNKYIRELLEDIDIVEIRFDMITYHLKSVGTYNLYLDTKFYYNGKWTQFDELTPNEILNFFFGVPIIID